MKKKYILVGGEMISRYDECIHYINAKKLCLLYGLNPRECYLIEEREPIYYHREILDSGLKILRPRYDGNYKLK